MKLRLLLILALASCLPAAWAITSSPYTVVSKKDMPTLHAGIVEMANEHVEMPRHRLLRLDGEKADKGLVELKLAMRPGYPGHGIAQRVYQEFELTKEHLGSRGYREAVEEDVTLTHALVIYGHSDWEDNGYTFEFSYSEQMLPVSGKWNGSTIVPQVFMRGTVHVKCNTEKTECEIEVFNPTNVGIEWGNLPWVRGGESSAGGGK